MADEIKIVPEAPRGKMEITGGEGMNINYEQRANSSTEKSIDQSVQEKQGEQYGEALTKIQSHQTSDDEDQAHSIHMDAERVFHKTDAESQIEHLVDIAMEKGPIYAVKVAKHLQDNYVLDMLHDRLLTEEFHRILVSKKLIDEN